MDAHTYTANTRVPRIKCCVHLRILRRSNMERPGISRYKSEMDKIRITKSHTLFMWNVTGHFGPGVKRAWVLRLLSRYLFKIPLLRIDTSANPARSGGLQIKKVYRVPKGQARRKVAADARIILL